MTKRIVSGLICTLLLIVMFLSTLFPYSLNLAVSIVSLCCINEIIILKKEFKFSYFYVISAIFSTVRPLIGPGTKWQVSLYFYSLSCIIIAMTRFVKNKKKSCSKHKSVWDVWFIFFLNIVISVSLGTIIGIRNLGKGFGVLLSILSLGIAWMCDIGAYITGKYFGKHKLSPYVSPNKTVEGAIGGIILSFIYSILFYTFCLFYFKNIPIDGLKTLTMSFLFFFLAILGDLCFSLLKRMLSIKDFGDIIPGHGGVLDRFDSVIFVSPFIFLFLRIFNFMR